MTTYIYIYIFFLLQKLRMSPLNECKSTVAASLNLPEGGKRFSFQNTVINFWILENYRMDKGQM